MDEARVAQPLVTTKAQAGKPVQIVVQNAPDTTTPIDPSSSEERAELPDEPWHTSPLFYEIANFLGVDSRDYDSTADQISVITDWAIQQTNSNKVEDIMYTIRELEEKLQPPAWGERKTAHLYRFLRMESRYSATKKALGAYTKTGKWE